MTSLRRRVGSETEGSFEGRSSSFIVESSPEGQPLPVTRVTMARDRTGEFAAAIRSLQGRHLVRAVAVQDPQKARNIQHYAEFMIIAKTIGKNIGSTYTKLEKLTILAKRKPLFNDQPTEIQELTYIIKEDLNALNSQIARLQEVMKSQKAQSRAVSKNNHLMSHSSSVVISLQSKLASMSSQFKAVLEVRTENLRDAKRRRDQFSVTGPGSSGSSAGPSVLLAHQNQQAQVAIDMDQASSSQPLLQQQQLVAFQDDTDQYLTSRAETMQNIESTIVELGGIFQQLAHMVKEQEEMVDRIDANVNDAELSVEAAHSEILKYFQSVTSNRWLMIKVFGVLIFFFMFFLVFMA